jgi:thymidylate synthase ThyX
MSSSVKVIADSVSTDGKRITTLECRYWRGIHSELMTHRAFARNAASSRAIPFAKYLKNGEPDPKCTISMLMENSFIPEFIGVEQKGMQSGNELSGESRESVLRSIDRMRQFCLEEAKLMHKAGCHKSIINRYLEPFSYVTVVITATEWDNFFKLRIHPAAEKHFDKLARRMRTALDGSEPSAVGVGKWHLPYIQPDDWLEIAASESQILSLAKDISAARCARVSYLNHDGSRSIKDDLALADRLKNPGDGAAHLSPFEHVATPLAGRSGPFFGWFQYRKEFDGD